MFPQPPRCPGCGRQIGFMSAMCGDCAAAEAAQRAEEERLLMDSVEAGLGRLEGYLLCHARFAEWLTDRRGEGS